jgi:hypothetical protein
MKTGRIIFLLVIILIAGCGGQTSGPTNRVSAKSNSISLGEETVITVDFSVDGAAGFYDSTSINIAIPSNLRLKFDTAELQGESDNDVRLDENIRFCPNFDGDVYEIPIASTDFSDSTVRNFDDAQIRFVVVGAKVGEGIIKAFQRDSFPDCEEILASSSVELVSVRN